MRIFSNVSPPSLRTISSLLGGVTHHGVATAIDEENTIVYLWLQLINPGFTLLVKQRHGAELRSCSLASLKPEVSQALASLQDELRTRRYSDYAYWGWLQVQSCHIEQTAVSSS
ncbi:hypothetical protein NP493_13g08007 [Ridgeia piscesae]|uniref:Uncharacterized protein n=1 Tax=Ridgeia piscesae TaxID=27915 RepID=A0AAD9PEP3_RIDPI|nr:hypothetical protein NP493_13g08007 [Ridgeia piscesae]